MIVTIIAAIVIVQRKFSLMGSLIANITVMGSTCLIFLGLLVFIVLSQKPNIAASQLNDDDTILVDIPEQGPVLGNFDTTVWTQQRYMQFRGIPYAESTSGEGRFMPPYPRKPWEETFNATTFGRPCPGILTNFKPPYMDPEEDLEDCLSLSIYTKALNASRTVMFYVHGGGFNNGSAMDHPPGFLLEKDIVLVVIQYRLGPFGWLTTIEPDMPGNVAAADVTLALQWVQKYIHVFGGDPRSITLFGQSAGAAISSAILISKKTPEETFPRIIVQSGSIFAGWAITPNPKEQAERVCSAAYCGNCQDYRALRNCLVKIPVVNLLNASFYENFALVAGDLIGILPGTPGDLVNYHSKNVTLMTGVTKHDGTFVLAFYYSKLRYMFGNMRQVTVRQFVDGMLQIQKDEEGMIDNLLTRLLFPANILDTYNHKNAIPAYIDLSNIIFDKSPNIALAKRIFKSKGKPIVYFYTFDYEGSHTRFGYGEDTSRLPFDGGVHHSNDNIYLFNTLKLYGKDIQMAKKMVDLWTSFAITGVPKITNDKQQIPNMENLSGPYFHIDTKIRKDPDFLKELTVTVDDPNKRKFIRNNIEF